MNSKVIFKSKSVFFILLAVIIGSCGSGQEQTKKEPVKADEHAKFLEKDESSPELFHVLISSDGYEVSQMKSEQTINRAEDKGGDKYMSDELGKFNMIDEVREAVFFIQIRPDNGSLSKIRTQRSTAITEIDKVLTEDIQRWAYKFPQRRVTPTQFNIRYRVVLKKTMSDSEIMKELQKRAKERH